MFDTRNDLSLGIRNKAVKLLNDRLADAIDLGTQVKYAHWNVKGPNFIALHELFDKLAEAIEDQVDTLAERATALGGTAHGTLAQVARGTSLKPYPQGTEEGAAHVKALATVLGQYGAQVRAGIDAAAQLGDAGTADLFTGISREADKYLWFLEAHLHGKR
jgi:starvation-inducible DNA-binding protein